MTPKMYSMNYSDGSLIWFVDYRREADFEDFLALLSAKLGVDIAAAGSAKSALRVDLPYLGAMLTASYRSDAGCYLHVPRSSAISATEIVVKCNGLC